MTSLSTWFLEQPRLTKPIVVVRVRVCGVLNVREAMTRSVEERETRVKSDCLRTFLLTLRTPVL